MQAGRQQQNPPGNSSVPNRAPSALGLADTHLCLVSPPCPAAEYNLDSLKSELSASMSPRHAALQSLTNPGDDFATLVSLRAHGAAAVAAPPPMHDSLVEPA